MVLKSLQDGLRLRQPARGRQLLGQHVAAVAPDMLIPLIASLVRPRQGLGPATPRHCRSRLVQPPSRPQGFAVRPMHVRVVQCFGQGFEGFECLGDLADGQERLCTTESRVRVGAQFSAPVDRHRRTGLVGLVQPCASRQPCRRVVAVDGERLVQEVQGLLVVAVLRNEVGREVRPAGFRRIERLGLAVGRDSLLSEAVDVVRHCQATAQRSGCGDTTNRLQQRFEVLPDIRIVRIDGGYDQLIRSIGFGAPGEQQCRDRDDGNMSHASESKRKSAPSRAVRGRPRPHPHLARDPNAGGDARAPPSAEPSEVRGRPRPHSRLALCCSFMDPSSPRRRLAAP